MYDYSLVNYKGSNIKVIIICKIHGEFKQIPIGHSIGKGCNKCAILSVHKQQMINQEEFIKKAIAIHGDRYDYSEGEYVGRSKNIIIICKKHGRFIQNAGNHLCGNGCPKCNGWFGCSKCGLWRVGKNKLCSYCKPKNENKLYYKTKEMKIARYLKKMLPNIEFIHNKSVGNDCTGGHLFPDIRFDCDTYNLIVEVDEHKHRGANYKCDKRRMYDIVAKLGQPCVFIRYNPDHRGSDKTILLKKVKKYLRLDVGNINFDDYGLKKRYLNY